jgi:hypothetical protein
MKTKFLTIATLLFFVATSTISMAFSPTDIKKENRKVADFDKISMSIPADLYLTQGSKNDVVIEADEDILAKIETEVDGDKLIIRFERWYNYRGTKSIKVYVTMKDIRKLVLAGSGDIISKSPIKTEKLGLVISGSGSILLDDLNVINLYSVISGSGDIRVEGKNVGGELEATVTGSGDIYTTSLEFKKADLTITGSGSIKAAVIDELDANITGSGRISYTGNPLIDANITGSGKIRNNN